MSLELLEIEEELSEKCCNFFLGQQANLDADAKNVLSLAFADYNDNFLKSFMTNSPYRL